ncbi:MAG: response regulator transcription factor, partial [Phreatobacter sp.]
MQDAAMPVSRGLVIVVDDDEAVRNSLKFALELEGLEVRLYGGADELLAGPRLPAEGCLLIDYRMPLMTGVELVRTLRARQVKLPAILMTVDATAELRGRAQRTGFQKVLE